MERKVSCEQAGGEAGVRRAWRFAPGDDEKNGYGKDLTGAWEHGTFLRVKAGASELRPRAMMGNPRPAS